MSTATRLDANTDTNALRALYVGGGGWALLDLPGRTVDEAAMAAAVTAANALRQQPGPGDSCWPVVHAAVRQLGLTVREFAAAIGVAMKEVPDPSPPERRAQYGFWSRIWPSKSQQGIDRVVAGGLLASQEKPEG